MVRAALSLRLALLRAPPEMQRQGPYTHAAPHVQALHKRSLQPLKPRLPLSYLLEQPSPHSHSEFYESFAAAGKSTLVRLLEKHSDEWEVIPEPIAKWCNIQTSEDECKVGALHLGA